MCGKCDTPHYSWRFHRRRYPVGTEHQGNASAIASAKGVNAKAITALLDVETLKASKNQKEDIAAALKALTEAEDSKMLFGAPEPNPVGTGNLIGQVHKTPSQSTDTLSDRLSYSVGACYRFGNIVFGNPHHWG